MILSLPLLGLLAGVLTTVAGIGGGMLLVLVLSLAWGPAAALAGTAPALLLGNLHRLYLFRRDIDARTAGPFAAGAVPGSVAGGLLAVALPERALHALMAAMAAAAITRALGLWTLRPSPSFILPAGLVIGALAATAGGAGVLVGPLFMATGLKGEAYIATVAAAAVAMHAGRIVAYGAGGLFTPEIALFAAVLAVAILAGNLAGRRLRRHISEAMSARIEIGTLIGCVTIAILGVGR